MGDTLKRASTRLNILFEEYVRLSKSEREPYDHKRRSITVAQLRRKPIHLQRHYADYIMQRFCSVATNEEVAALYSALGHTPVPNTVTCIGNMALLKWTHDAYVDQFLKRAPR